MRHQGEPPSGREPGSILFLFSLLGLLSLAATPAAANGHLFFEDFESYEAGSNLRGQGGWDGLTNQGNASEMPLGDAELLDGGRVLSTRLITQADRIHQIGHALPAFDPGKRTTFSVRVYAGTDSINSGIGVGSNPLPGPEIASNEGFFSTYRTGWYSTADGWSYDLRGVAGNDMANFFAYTIGLGEAVTLRIVVDGPRRAVHGEMVHAGGTVTTPSRTILPGMIAELDAVAIFSDRSLPGRGGIEVDDIELVAVPGSDPSPCGDVNANGALTAADALAVLRAAVGQAVALDCGPEAPAWSTGQSTCHDAGGAPVSCIDSGQDGEYRLGVPHAFADNGDGTITDATTGLTWEKLAPGDGFHDPETIYNWHDAIAVKIAALNAAAFAGYDDWRLPNRYELESIVDLTGYQPAVAPAFLGPCTSGCGIVDCSCTDPHGHWTSTTFHDIPEFAWVISMGDGTAYADGKSDGSGRVRAVRGGR